MRYNYFHTLIAITLLAVLCGQASSASSSTTTAEIFYASLGDGDTYTPITRSNIEDEHERYGQVNVRNPEFLRLMRILSQAQTGRGCFNPKRVRLKIRTSDSIVFVDEDGVVESASGLRFLSESDKNIVKHLLESEVLTDFPTALPPPRLALEELETCN